MRHGGSFICVPPKYAFIWKKLIEKAVFHHISEEAWSSRLKGRNARVGKDHLISFEKENPIFHERCGVTACFNPESDMCGKREMQREEQRIRDLIKETEKKEKKIEEWKRKFNESLEEGRKMGVLSSQIELLPHIIETKEAKEAKEAKEMKVDTKDMKEILQKNYSYSQEMRNLAIHFAAIGVSFRKIPLCIKEVMNTAFPNEIYEIPSITTVIRMVKEGGILSTLQALKSLHDMASPLLGQDCTSSCGRQLLVLSALGSKTEGKPIIHTSEIVRKDAASQASTIQTMLSDLKSLVSLFPETSHFVSSLNPSKFVGIMSDHTAVNKKIVDNLNEREGIELLDLKCSAHKSNLIEDSFLKSLEILHGEEVRMELPSDVEISIGMNAPQNPSVLSAETVLYQLTKSISPTGQDKFGFGASFDSIRLLLEKKVKMIPIDGSRFHIYSQNSLQIYQHLPFLDSFLDTYLNHDTWTYQFLKKGLSNTQCLSEIRLLAVFGYFFAVPMMYSFRKYTIGQMPILWQTAEKLLVSLITNNIDIGTHNLLWNYICSIEVDDEKKKDIKNHSADLQVALSFVLNDWNHNDQLNFQKSLEKSLTELQKIAKEYLSNGSLADNSLFLENAPADNLEIESYIGKWKEKDTHARHLSTQSLSSVISCTHLSSDLTMSPESMAKIRKIVAHEMLTQREIDLHLAAEKRVKRLEDIKAKEEKESRKRKRDEQIRAEIDGVEKVRDLTKIQKMSNVELRSQLLLWKSEGNKVHLNSNKDERVRQLAQLLNANHCEKH